MKKVKNISDITHDCEGVVLDGVEYHFVSHYLDVLVLLPKLDGDHVRFIAIADSVPEKELYVV